MKSLHLALILVVLLVASAARGDVFRWDTGALIPGTEGVNPGPAAQFDNLSLHYANLRSLDLTNASFAHADLTWARLTQTTLAGADFTGAIVSGTYLQGTVSRGFTQTQLVSTASYQSKSLGRISLGGNDLTGWDFHGQNLGGAQITSAVVNGANFSDAELTGAAIYGGTGLDAVFDNANLTGAYLWNMNYSNASFRNANLTNARISNGDVTGADFTGASIGSADLSSSKFSKEQLYSTASYLTGDLREVWLMNLDLTGANLSGQDLTRAFLTQSKFASATFDNAVVREADLSRTTESGFTAAQLYSTTSYQQHELTGVNLSWNDLTGWDLSQSNLSRASFYDSVLNGVDFSGSRVTGATFVDTDLTKEQLYATASYQDRELQQIRFSGCDLRGADFRGMDLRDAVLEAAKLEGADLTDANIENAVFSKTTQLGLTREQIYSTATYQAGHLRGVGLFENDLRGWDFSKLDLTGAQFFISLLADANFEDAIVQGAGFHGTVLGGFTEQMLQSTASYQRHDLRGVEFGNNNLTGWNFRDQDLTEAEFLYSTLGGADFTNARISKASFRNTVSRGFTKEQLYSTASYAEQDLRGIAIDDNKFDGWDFRGQYVVDADFSYATVVGANFSGADARGAFERTRGWASFTGAITDNMIFPDGSIRGLHLIGGETLRVRDYDPRLSFPARITAVSEVAIEANAVLKLEFEADDWNSTIAFQPGIDVTINGTLELIFGPGVEILAQVGRTFQAFDWTGVSPSGTFSLTSTYPWDVSELYTTGNVTLLLPGDVNGDYAVDVEDLNAVRNNFGGVVEGDTNNDGVVDMIDLNNVRNFFGAAAPQSVPEPASSGIMACGFSFLLLGRTVFRPIWR